jgi:hypothetical protein
MNGLTNGQAQEYNRDKKVQTYFTTNASKVSSYAPLNDQFEDFEDHVSNVESLVPRKTVNNTGIATAKKLKKSEAASFWSSICNKGRAYALGIHDEALAADLKRSRSAILKLKDGDVLPFCTHVNDTLSPLVGNADFDNYGITAAVLTSGMTIASDFKNLIGAPGEARADKTAADQELNETFGKLRLNVEQFVLLMSHFESSDPDFLNGFNAVNVIDDIGVHHNGIQGFVKSKSDGSPIVDATILHNSNGKSANGKSATSDLLGFYNLIKLKPGLNSFDVSAPGKKTLSSVIKILKGQTLEVDFQMENGE